MRSNRSTNFSASADRAPRLRVFALTMLALAAAWPQAQAETLILQGSSTVNHRILQGHQQTVEGLAGHKLTVIPSRSSLGVLGLLEGRAQMAMISAPLQGEIDALRKTRPGLPYERLRAFELGRTPVAIAVHPSNHFRAASWETLKQILLGEIDNWNALGGPDLPIRVVMAAAGGGVTVATESLLLGGRSVAAPNLIQVQSGPQVIKVVEQEPSAIAFAQLSLVRSRGIPEVEIERPIEQVLALVTLGEPTPAMMSVIDAMRSIAAKVM
jgi:phosphate transport system substrate-binding protein